MSTSTADIKQDMEILKTRIETLSGLFAQEVDIHTHTRQIGPHYQHFNVIDQKYNLSSRTQPLEVVIKEILARCPEACKKNITTVLNTIRATTRADNETQANLQELLIRTWSLVNTPNNYSNAFDILIQNLDHNIATGGGCVPGIAARLIQPYTHFVLNMLSNTYNQSRTVTASGPNVSISKKGTAQNSSSNNVDSELAEALRLSQLEIKQKGDTVDPELEQALQLSSLEAKFAQAEKAKKINVDPELEKALRLSLETTRKTDAAMADEMQLLEILRISKLER
jgi:hypothetical protein